MLPMKLFLWILFAIRVIISQDSVMQKHAARTVETSCGSGHCHDTAHVDGEHDGGERNDYEHVDAGDDLGERAEGWSEEERPIGGGYTWGLASVRRRGGFW
ncbi:hypothetical protein BV25DRAFT_1921137 [Artomyces pyxidatus]|uniref:Uncharacterized protein n=1 Tax=Artomyces pyxidatus TaxID=48021 RepID=A0ACB8SK93_9AGAM|nr:hypothetical protein BV25DRAFT_1921137 [Artomyces pyxidatus]